MHLLSHVIIDGESTRVTQGALPEARSNLTSPDPLVARILPILSAMLHLLPDADRTRIGILLGTRLGCLRDDAAFDDSRRPDPRFASPAAFARTLPSTLAAELSVKLAITGPVFVMIANDFPAAPAHRRARLWLHHFDLPAILTGSFDYPFDQPMHADLQLFTRDGQ